MKQVSLILFLVALLSTLTFSLLEVYDPAIIRDKIEAKTYDIRMSLLWKLKTYHPTGEIIIVYIDEKSIADIGRWPWPRSIMAELLNRISSDRPRVIGIDIMFSERQDASNDARLARAIKDAGNVVLATAFMVPTGGQDVRAAANRSDSLPTVAGPDYLWDSAFMTVKTVSGIDWKRWVIKADKVNLPISDLAAHAYLGHVYSNPDLDGVMRWEYLYLNYGVDCYPHFALQVARVAKGIDIKDMVLFGASGIRLGQQFIPTGLNGRTLIHYVPPGEGYRSIPASDVIRGTRTPGLFTDKVVLLGTSALATYDVMVTPFSANTPGVAINANVVDNILHNSFLKKSPGVIELSFIIITGIFLGVLLPRLGAFVGSAVSILVIALYVAAGIYLLAYAGLWINYTYPLTNMSLIFFSQTLVKFFLEERRARDIKRMFSRYVSPKIVEELVNHPDETSLGGRKRLITVLFSDIAGFTNLSENLSPEEVVSRLNEYFTEMVGLIFQYNGTLNKFIGDALMAFWGAPLSQPDQAELAVRCALHMITRIKELQAKWHSEGKITIDIGIGINSGEVLVGNIGAEGMQMDYTIIGDDVNLGSRIEALTRKYKTHMLISEFTVQLLREGIANNTIKGISLRGIERVVVKGKKKPVTIYEVTSLDPQSPSTLTEPEEDRIVEYKEK
ncbi:MAG: adenylate/guanylate cyclase domain-containing protein [Nitrospirae bacterium]|nr:adenylate/guanylate cyclase domain-containing protein [Nitrospirota bacterium]